MIKKDLIWISGLLLIIALLIFPATHGLYLLATRSHPYIMGFVKVSILASMGELLAARIARGTYKKSPGFIWKFVVWGFLGMAFVLVFDLFSTGVAGAMKKGLIPSLQPESGLNALLLAFFTSALMNMIFGPAFMMLHRITDAYIDLGEGNLQRIAAVRLSDATAKIDWQHFIGFVLLKTIPLFWIPAHTVMFLLPPEYRVLMAAFLSIALGVFLSLASNKNKGARYAA